MGIISERYAPVPVAANATIRIPNSSIGGFLCTVTGTINVTTNASEGTVSTNIVVGLPVTAGVYYPLPYFLGANGGTFVASGGAAGTLGV